MDLSCSEKTLGVIRKVRSLESFIFSPLPPPTLFSIMKEQILNLSEVLLIGLTG